MTQETNKLIKRKQTLESKLNKLEQQISSTAMKLSAQREEYRSVQADINEVKATLADVLGINHTQPSSGPNSTEDKSAPLWHHEPQTDPHEVPSWAHSVNIDDDLGTSDERANLDIVYDERAKRKQTIIDDLRRRGELRADGDKQSATKLQEARGAVNNTITYDLGKRKDQSAYVG